MAEQLALLAPIAIRVTRHQCPYCRRTRSSRLAAVAHIARCFRSPGAHGCRTCAAFQPAERGDLAPYGYPGCPEGCDAGIDLSEGLKIHCPSWESPDNQKPIRWEE